MIQILDPLLITNMEMMAETRNLETRNLETRNLETRNLEMPLLANGETTSVQNL